MHGFLIEYHRPTGDWRLTDYPGADGPRAALERRLELDADRTDTDWEYVTLNAASLATVKRTHSRYFMGRELDSNCPQNVTV
ncbi:hypothetical protein [Gryllotalpicola koreensis]|uniref:DUF2188 domain-containing protein n=1 Tax=Gryllotalpicola koreensis TaxID=993086 RepID=A0ABP8A1W9_9MICO